MPEEKTEYTYEHNKKHCREGDHLFNPKSEDTIMLVELCEVCGRKEYYPKDSRGKIDENRYRKNHEVDILQPCGKTKKRFERIYGKPKIPNIRPDYTIPHELIPEYVRQQRLRNFIPNPSIGNQE